MFPVGNRYKNGDGNALFHPVIQYSEYSFNSCVLGPGTRTTTGVHQLPWYPSTYQKTPGPAIPTCRWNSSNFPSPRDPSHYWAFTGFYAVHVQHVDYQHHVASFQLERLPAVHLNQQRCRRMAPRPEPSHIRQVPASILPSGWLVIPRSATQLTSNPACFRVETKTDSATAIPKYSSESLRWLGPVPERRNIGKPPPENSFSSYYFLILKIDMISFYKIPVNLSKVKFNYYFPLIKLKVIGFVRYLLTQFLQ